MVSVCYSILYHKLCIGEKEKCIEYHCCVNEDNIWKVKLPEFVSDFR